MMPIFVAVGCWRGRYYPRLADSLVVKSCTARRLGAGRGAGVAGCADHTAAARAACRARARARGLSGACRDAPLIRTYK